MADEEEKDTKVDEDIEKKVDAVGADDSGDEPAEEKEAVDEAVDDASEVTEDAGDEPAEPEAPARDRIDDLTDAVASIASQIGTLMTSVQSLVDATADRDTGDRVATASEGDVDEEIADLDLDMADIPDVDDDDLDLTI